MTLYRSVLAALAPSQVLHELELRMSRDGVIVQFFGCRRAGDLITEKLKRHRERVLHLLLRNKFRVRAALAPTTSNKFHLLVVGVESHECT